MHIPIYVKWVNSNLSEFNLFSDPSSRSVNIKASRADLYPGPVISAQSTSHDIPYVSSRSESSQYFSSSEKLCHSSQASSSLSDHSRGAHSAIVFRWSESAYNGRDPSIHWIALPSRGL